MFVVMFFFQLEIIAKIIVKYIDMIIALLMQACSVLKVLLGSVSEINILAHKPLVFSKS